MLMICKPKLTVLTGAVESLVTSVALIIVMGLWFMVPTDPMLEAGAGFVTMPEMPNFIIAGGLAYIAWSQGLRALHVS